MKYYKLLDDDNTGHYFKFKWNIKGKWMSVKGPLKMCSNGFHVLRLKDIIYWINCGFNLYEVEVRGDKIVEDNKVCVRSVRVVKRIKSFNRQSLLNKVIKPACERAKKYASAARAAFAAADTAARAAFSASAAEASAAADTAAFYAAAAAARAASAAAVAAAAYASAAAVAAAYKQERRKQTKDLRGLLK